MSAKKTVIILLYQATANQTSESRSIMSGKRTLEAYVTGTGSVAATVNVYGCNTDRTSNGVLVSTIVLSGTGSDQAGAELTVEWPYLYAVLSGISGTGATVNVSVGV